MSSQSLDKHWWGQRSVEDIIRAQQRHAPLHPGGGGAHVQIPTEPMSPLMTGSGGVSSLSAVGSFCLSTERLRAHPTPHQMSTHWFQRSDICWLNYCC